MPSFYLILIIISIVVVNLLLGLHHLKMRRHYSSLYRAERTKSHFAKARNEMMRMAVEKSIDISTNYYKALYHLNTVIMRNPDSYSEISKELEAAMMSLNTSHGDEEVTLQLTENEKEISLLTANAFSHIVVDYSPFLRNLYRVGRFLIGSDYTKDHLFFGTIIVKEIEKRRAERKIKAAQSKLYQLSSNFALAQ